jgi:hypothetical protein
MVVFLSVLICQTDVTPAASSNRRGMKSGPVTPTAFIADPALCCVLSVPCSVKQLSIVSIPGSTIKLK